MANIKAEAGQFLSSIKASVANGKADFEALISDVKAQAAARIGSLTDGTVIGIHATKVADMTAAIQTAVNNIDKHLQTVHTETDPSQAFADEGMQIACRQYIEGVMEVCSAYTSQLLKLATELDEIKAFYETEQEKQSSTLSSAGKEVSSSVERYVYGGGASN